MKLLTINKNKLFFEDGTVIEVNIDIIYEENIKAGEEISDEKLEIILEKGAYFKGITYLAKYDKSEKALFLKLAEKYGKNAAEKSIKKIKDNGYIDDFEYAKSFLAGKNYSKKQAYFELVKRGVSELQVKKVIENYGNIEKDTIKKLIKKLSNKDEKKRIETLLRKGFDYSKIKEVLKELKEKGE